MWFLEGSGGTVLTSFHFGAGGAPCRAAVTILHLSFFNCINNDEMNTQTAVHEGGKVVVSINHFHLTGSGVCGPERFIPGLRTLRNPRAGCAPILPCEGHAWFEPHSLLKKKVSYERCHPVCIKAFPVRKKNWT